ISRYSLQILTIFVKKFENFVTKGIWQQSHNRGESKSTRRYRPWKLIYYEACRDEGDANRREKYLKTSQGRRMLKIRLKGYVRQ
ncbi:MAG: hypothetical protein EOM19_07170, partial [Candidatus Moranbacteria bacterium]|nr:hypothetical protein [Candidatus Moranbacteria bacterium]